MPRIHEVEEPKLKTLFCFNVPKPREQDIDPRIWQEVAESAQFSVMFSHWELAIRFEKELPPYIVRAIYPDIEQGYVNLSEESKVERVYLHPDFDGGTVFYELSPLYDKATVFAHIYATLREIGEAVAEEKGLEVDWDEAYAYRGAQMKKLIFDGPRIRKSL